MRSEIVVAPRPPLFVLVIRALIGAILVAMIAWMLWRHVSPLRLSVLHFVGRSECDYEQSVNAQEWNRRLARRAEEMRKGSSLAGKEADRQRWKTPRGEFWFPGAMPDRFPVVLAEMDLDIYGARRAIGQGYVVLDCGAGFGSFTRLALDSGAGRVVAIEVSPIKQQCLRRTFQKEIAEGRVVVYPKGVWDKDDQLMLRGDSVVFDGGRKPVPVQVTTIDKIASELGISRIDVIRFDIAGADRNAISGAQNSLKQYRPKLLIASAPESDNTSVLPSLVKSIVPTYQAELDSCQDMGTEVRARSLRLSSR